MERKRYRTQPSYQDFWREREIEPNLLIRIYGEKKKQNPTFSTVSMKREREAEPKLLIRIHGERAKQNTTFSSGSIERERSRIQPSHQDPLRERSRIQPSHYDQKSKTQSAEDYPWRMKFNPTFSSLSMERERTSPPTLSTVSKEKQREVESNPLKRIRGMRERQNPTWSKGYME